MSNTSESNQRVNSTVKKLAIIAIAMFGFGFLLVPIYDVFCDITGLNGKTENTAAAGIDGKPDTSRTIRITFTATNNEQMPWEFYPGDTVIEVHPGEIVNTHFFARNTTAKDMVSQSIPSVAPNNAAQYFHKTECFCFNNQPLKAGESAELGLQFYVDKDLPRAVKNITLAYTIFDITKNVSSDQKVAGAG